MAVSSKWWIGLFILYLMVGILCYTAQGTYSIGSNSGSAVTEGILKMSTTPSDITTFFSNASKMITWQFDFFESGIGLYIKYILWCFTAGIWLPFVYDVARLVAKPFGG